MTGASFHQQLKIKIKLYTKTIAFVILVGGYAVYTLGKDSLEATKGIFIEINNDGSRQLSNLLPATYQDIPNNFCPVKSADPKYLAIFHFFGVIYLFIGLAIIADEFFCPALDVLADNLGLSHDVAGATLMAAGGSAPELFANLIGTFLRSDVGFGTIVGSAVFNVLFVVGFCAIVTTTPMKLTAWPLLRDSTFYSITLIVLALFFGVLSPQKIDLSEALILFSLYWVYVLIMYYNSTLSKYFYERYTPLSTQNNGNTNLYVIDTKNNDNNNIHNNNSNSDKECENEFKPPLLVRELSNNSNNSIKFKTQRSNSFSNSYRQESQSQIIQNSVSETFTAHTEEEIEDGVSMAFPPTGSGFFAWFWYILTFPLYFLFIYTIIDVQKKNKDEYAILAFLVCLIWMGILSYFLVNSVEIIGATLGIPSVIMGLTFLAAGTSIPDMLAAIIVAKKGLSDKAVSSSLGSNVFDITVGLALPWLLYNIIYKIPVIVIADGFLISIIILFLTLIIMILTIKFKNWELPKSSGYFFIFLYFVYVIQQVVRSPYGVC